MVNGAANNQPAADRSQGFLLGRCSGFNRILRLNLMLAAAAWTETLGSLRASPT